MGNDAIEINGQKFVPEQEGGDEGQDESKYDDNTIDEATKEVMERLGIKDLKDKVDEMEKNNQQNKGGNQKKKQALVNVADVINKSPEELTKREKICGFFQGALRNNDETLKALSEGTAADGGYLFPDEFRAEVIRDIEEQPFMRNEVRVVPMQRDILNVPTLEDGPQVTWTQENSTKSTTTASFGQKTLTAKKMAAIMYMSDELIADSTEIDVVDFIIQLFSESIGEEEDRVITQGGGSSEPTGITNASGVGSVSVNGNLGFDDLISLQHELPQKYHPNAKFYVHRNNINELRKIKDSNGRYLWQEAKAPDQASTFHGYPVVENNHLPESTILFGDLSQAYWLGDRQRMTVKTSRDVKQAFEKDQTAVRVVSRIAGNVVRPQAVKKLTGIP